ncbi:MAG: Rieske 2Fe-2S domain-containing protein [Actinomycetota bacterium]|nr:Rieske 2Fe-2S domain-containing protein [Actinomycetota bacterium]
MTQLHENSAIDVAPKNRSAEVFVGVCFFLSVLATIGLAITYWVGGQPQVEGGLLFVTLGGIGFGMVAWGKYLVPQGPFVQEREVLKSEIVEKQAMLASLDRGQKQLGRRSFLGKMLGASIGLFGAINLFPFLRSLGPVPKKALTTTPWKKDALIVGPDGLGVNTATLEVGGILTVFPSYDVGGAISQTVLIRVADQNWTTKPGRETWGPQGYLAFSKLCTHAGCPVGLYQELTQQLLCPCHQSLFDVLTGATQVFGPAPRPLPQLPIYFDSNGNLRAQSGYLEPVGPGYWERG